jgi:hypothetical protein
MSNPCLDPKILYAFQKELHHFRKVRINKRDKFCWYCHCLLGQIESCVDCVTCFRVFHDKCHKKILDMFSRFNLKGINYQLCFEKCCPFCELGGAEAYIFRLLSENLGNCATNVKERLIGSLLKSQAVSIFHRLSPSSSSISSSSSKLTMNSGGGIYGRFNMEELTTDHRYMYKEEHDVKIYCADIDGKSKNEQFSYNLYNTLNNHDDDDDNNNNNINTVNEDIILSCYRKNDICDLLLCIVSQRIGNEFKDLRYKTSHSWYKDENTYPFVTISNSVDNLLVLCSMGRLKSPMRQFFIDLSWVEHSIKSCSNDGKGFVKNCGIYTIDLCSRFVWSILNEICHASTCIDCVLNYYDDNNYFIKPCSPTPHIIILAKLDGSPYWPAKVFGVYKKKRKVVVKFFGTHTMDIISIDKCKPISKNYESNICPQRVCQSSKRIKTTDFIRVDDKEVGKALVKPTRGRKSATTGLFEAINEMNCHIDALEAKFGIFVYEFGLPGIIIEENDLLNVLNTRLCLSDTQPTQPTTDPSSSRAPSSLQQLAAKQKMDTFRYFILNVEYTKTLFDVYQ